ncbi:Hsp20/alpha crystallin family protein [Maribacter sp. HTCC2170]|uniref:Hsp20/alpha crystallin family protein n=1 Tax=Maribacter sp. (strain HTCC2170 / KCCM 42371) TaxID=313603 RepID=UPI00006B21B2|nr:Hsp20/alpha crystallin family protein [Maribacter sp. HTCC2170]EAR00071.1 small heat shock protein [Maribacter sp. HTCC2170]
MSLVKFRKRRPFGSLVTSDFFDMEDFFDNRFWNQGLVNDSFWNGRKGEPALNIKENEANFEIELAAPGFAKKDFEITIDDGYLNVSAKKSTSEEEKEDDFTRREFSYKSFERSLQLPENVKEEEIKAKYKDGILSFKLEKMEEAKKAKPKVVEIA